MGYPALTPASLPPSPESSKTEADLTEGNGGKSLSPELSPARAALLSLQLQTPHC